MFPPSIYFVEFHTPHATAPGMIPACCARHALATARDLMGIEGVRFRVVENLEIIIAAGSDTGFDFILPDYETAIKDAN